jgi:Spy/CpxP family protein refolding chaperone
MKKSLVFTAILVAILTALAAVGFALAGRNTPPTPYGPGMMGGQGGGMMGGFRSDDGYGPMHDAMEEAMAGALGITEEELEERFAAGDTAWTIAQEKGLTQEEFTQWMTEARSQAFAKLVDEGVLTQEQADWMQERMGTRLQNGFGDGTGTCMGGGTRGGRGGWNTQP